MQGEPESALFKISSKSGTIFAIKQTNNRDYEKSQIRTNRHALFEEVCNSKYHISNADWVIVLFPGRSFPNR